MFKFSKDGKAQSIKTMKTIADRSFVKTGSNSVTLKKQKE
jgi:hypothetical protein